MITLVCVYESAQFFIKKWANLGPFFVYFRSFSNTDFTEKIVGFSDCWSRRRARWPLDHHHGPNQHNILCTKASFSVAGCTSWHSNTLGQDIHTQLVSLKKWPHTFIFCPLNTCWNSNFVLSTFLWIHFIQIQVTLKFNFN